MKYEEIVDQIVDEIEKVKNVKNYYEVDPDTDYVKAQFEIVMQDDTVWEVEFRKGSGFWWRGNVYPWRIIQINNDSFTQIAFSLRMLKSYMKTVKAIQSESVVKANQILKDVEYITESVFDGIYSSDTFEAIFNMPDESFAEFIQLCKQIRKEKNNYKPEYAYSIVANGKLGEKFVNMIKMNR